MMIIGCDFHSQLATSLLAGHGDGRKRRAEAGTGQWRCGTILPASGGAGADRDGSHGEMSLAGGSVSRNRARIVGWWFGPESMQIWSPAGYRQWMPMIY